MIINFKSFIIIIFLVLAFSSDALAEWNMWVIPEKRVINKNESLRFKYGVSGGGYLDPQEMKVTIYSEYDSKLKMIDVDEQYEMFASIFKITTENDMFTKTVNDLPSNVPNDIFFEAERSSPFKTMWVTPESPGDKMIILILSYKDQNGSWLTVSKEFNYHVNSLAEQHEWWLTPVTIISIVVGIWANLIGNLRRKKKEKL